MSSTAAKYNVGLDVTGKLAVVVGGTQGIGAAVAKRLARAGASVTIVGRNEKLASEVIKDLETIGGNGKVFDFIKADLSTMSAVKELAKTLEDKFKGQGIDFLIQTQGFPPNGEIVLTSEGHEIQFATQVLSRVGLQSLLAKSGTLKGTIVNVCANASKAPPDLEDVEMISLKDQKLRSYQVIARFITRNGPCMDGFTAAFNRQYPTLRSFHIFPGAVTSNILANAGFSLPIRLLWSIISPIISRTIGNSPESYAEIPVFCATNPKSRELGLEFSDPQMKPTKAAWLDDPQKTKAVWDKLTELGGFDL